MFSRFYSCPRYIMGLNYKQYLMHLGPSSIVTWASFYVFIFWAQLVRLTRLIILINTNETCGLIYVHHETHKSPTGMCKQARVLGLIKSLWTLSNTGLIIFQYNKARIVALYFALSSIRALSPVISSPLPRDKNGGEFVDTNLVQSSEILRKKIWQNLYNSYFKKPTNRRRIIKERGDFWKIGGI